MHEQYFDPIVNFPDRIDQLLDIVNRVGVSERFAVIFILILSYYLVICRSKNDITKLDKRKYKKL